MQVTLIGLGGGTFDTLTQQVQDLLRTHGRHFSRIVFWQMFQEALRS